MKVFISQPITGKSTAEIMATRKNITTKVKSKYPDATIINSVMLGGNDTNDIKYLGITISLMADADIIVFVNDISNSKGCQVEYYVASLYDKKIINESELDN